MYQTIFRRFEKKYFLTPEQCDAVLGIMTYNALPDKFGKTAICNLYYDTPDRKIIRASIEKPVYKEKLRLRCYGMPDKKSLCFIELKKKYKGIVYKRRISTDYADAISYLDGEKHNLPPSQIKAEIDYFREFYRQLEPSAAIFYKRTAFYDRNDPQIRFTIDSDILVRDYDTDLTKGIYGERLLDKNTFLLEIKTSGAMPVWVAEMLDRLRIYPTAFSKYGTAYQSVFEPVSFSTAPKKDTGNLRIIKGGIYCA